MLARVMSWLFAAVLLLLFVLAIAFHQRNQGTVILDFYASTRPLPVSMVVIGSVAVGALLGWLTAVARLVGARRRIRRLLREQRRLQDALAAGAGNRGDAS
ncbi:MAG: LapA family protein [Gammaproteobacteria bacterium]